MGKNKNKLFSLVLILSALLITVMITELFFRNPPGTKIEDSIETSISIAPKQNLELEVNSGSQTARVEIAERYVPKQLLVNFEKTTTDERAAEILEDLGGVSIKQYRSTPGLHLVALSNNLTVDDAVSRLSTLAEVAYSEKNIIYTTQDLPNDPFFNLLWGLHNFGQSGGKINIDLNAPEAWADSKGGSEIIIGVIDTGIDYNHTDLSPNIWSNPGEIPNNNIDDDNNGWIDDIHGINAILGNGDPMDDEGHGTHVSGTIAANGNDGIGVAGVMWQAKLIACKFLNNNGEGNLADAITCLDYFSSLADSGVDIVATNNSWGSRDYSGALFSAIQEHNSREILFVSSAGNEGRDVNNFGWFPASYNADNVISVAAIDHNSSFATFSNFGDNAVDIAAPGVNIYSTMPNNQWGYLSGTSMAAPHVTGIIGLTKSIEPSYTAQELKNHLLDTAISSDQLADKIINGRRAVIDLPFVDSDGDEMEDKWERKYGLDDNDPADANLDLDNDGLTNLEEFVLKTLPNNEDSDNDSLTDGNEVNIHNSDPLNKDTDDDGLLDAEEVNLYATAPDDSDTDGDGLGDYVEINTFVTNPLSSDSDNDMMPDGWEVGFNLNPNNNDASLDADSDGLTNLEEFNQGTSPILSDTDSDGLNDFDEINTFNTNPIDADTDGDRILDGWEILNSFNPLNGLDAYQDSDGDGFSNFQEFKGGTDPHDIASFPPNNGWYTFNGSADRNPVAYLVSDSNSFTTRWSYSFSEDLYQNYVVAVDKKLYLQVPKNLSKVDMSALSLADGKKSWSKSFFDVSGVKAPTYTNGNTYVQYTSRGVGIGFKSLDSETGDEQLEILPGNYVDSYVAYDGDLFYTTSPSIFRVDGANGQIKWQVDKNYLTYSNMAISRSYLATLADQHLHIYDVATGVEVGFPISVSCSVGQFQNIVLNDNHAYIFGDSCVAKVDLDTGEALWEISESNSIKELAYVGAELYLLTNDGVEIRGVVDGNLINTWPTNNYDTFVLTSNHLFLSNFNSTIALELSSGQEVWSDTVGGILAIDESGGLVILSRDGVKVVNLDGDSDSDGLLNWWERFYRFNLVDANDAQLDTDNDGLSNLVEFENSSDPNKADTDGDTINDFDEINVYYTSPTEIDSDFDGLSDSDEINVYSTNSNLADSDVDGFSDGDEVSIYKTDPNDFLSQPPKIKSFSESFENSFPANWKNTGDSISNWSIETSEFTDGSVSLRSGSVLENQLSAIEWVDYFNSGQLTFNFKHTSQTSNYYFNFYIDGQLKFYSNGTDGDWENISVFVNAGQRSLRWEVIKRNSNASYEDEIYIDEVEFEYSPFGSNPSNVIFANAGQLLEINQLGEIVSGPFEFAPHSSDDLVVTDNHEFAIAARPNLYIYNPDTGELKTKNAEVRNDYRLHDNLVAVDNSLIATNHYGGVVRFTQDGEFVEKGLLGRFWSDLKAGPHGYLYGLVGENYPAPIDRVSVISPNSLTVVNNISLPDSGIHKFEVNNLEEFYFLKDANVIIKTDPDGNEIKRINLSEITLDRGGFRIVDLTIQNNELLYVSTSSDKYFSFSLDLELISEHKIPYLNGSYPYIADIDFKGIDTDNDGLPNWWEIRHGLNPSNANDANVDTDNDGLTNVEEFGNYTYPNDADTDDDGLNDGEELNQYQSNPRSADSDNDGLSDGEEVMEWGTSPVYNDTDQDGVNDYEEVIVHGLDPLNLDTDGDSQSDGWELDNRLSPTNSNDAVLDLDEDGLSNVEEFIAGSNIYRVDSDFDSLSDYIEVHDFGTLPNQSDTDGDGMGDGWEIKYGFDPLVEDDSNIDSDGDGYSNALEFYTLSNPISADIRPSIPSWYTYQGNAQHTGYLPLSLNENDFSELWQTLLNQPSTKSYQASADAKQAYLINTNGLHVLSLRNGQIVWQDDLGFNYLTDFSQVAIDYDAIYVQSHIGQESTINSFNKLTGENIFTAVYGNQGRNLLAPVPYKNSIYFYTGQSGGVASYNKFGEQNWLNEFNQYGFGNWSPSVDDHSVYSYIRNAFYIFDRNNGSVLSSWIDSNYEFAGSMQKMAPVISNRGSVTFVQNERLLNLSIPNATENWIKEGFYGQQPAVFDGVIYTLSLGRLLALDEVTGEEQWRFISTEYLNRNIVATISHIFVSSNSKTWAVNRVTGLPEWEWDQGGKLSISPNGVLLIVQDNGNVTAIQLVPDDDNDGLPNVWEISSGTKIDVAGDELNDDDNDGITNLEEFQYGTSRLIADSDEDGLSDSEEVIVIGSNPTIPDSDMDGLFDGDEVNSHNTDPLESDTDRDGINDGEELDLGTNPLSIDSDGDEFSDALEIDQNTDPLDGNNYPNTILEEQINFENQMVPSGWKIPFNAHSGWSVSNQYSLSGNFSLRSENILDNEFAAIEWEVLTDEVDIQFSVMNSSIYNSQDFIFYVDGNEVVNERTPEWHTVRVNLSLGMHTLRWEYRKDGVLNDGDENDAVFIDDISITPSDTDNDGLPNYWERRYGISRFLPSRLQDPDQDGFNNFAEFEANTDPTDPNSIPESSIPNNPPSEEGGSSGGGGGVIEWYELILLFCLLIAYQQKRAFLIKR